MSEARQFEAVGEGVLVRAPAKLNLTLLVAGRRPDGFHELETIMAKIDLFDTVVIEPGVKTGIELLCRGLHWAPAGEDNLVYRAAQRLLQEAGVQRNLQITLTKNIPAGTGLGSASSDAAATLLGVDRLLGLGTDRCRVSEIAADLGSDVAFFLDGPLALCTGKGERIQPIMSKFPFVAVLIIPDVSISTKRVYANYHHDAERYEQWHRQIRGHLERNRIDLAAGMCANMLEASCFVLAEHLRTLKAEIESLGVRPICLSGSGSAMFCIVRDDETAQVCKTILDEKIGCTIHVVRSIWW